jgi:hypothetical protein
MEGVHGTARRGAGSMLPCCGPWRGSCRAPASPARLGTPSAPSGTAGASQAAGCGSRATRRARTPARTEARKVSERRQKHLPPGPPQDEVQRWARNLQERLLPPDHAPGPHQPQPADRGARGDAAGPRPRRLRERKKKPVTASCGDHGTAGSECTVGTWVGATVGSARARLHLGIAGGNARRWFFIIQRAMSVPVRPSPALQCTATCPFVALQMSRNLAMISADGFCEGRRGISRAGEKNCEKHCRHCGQYRSLVLPPLLDIQSKDHHTVQSSKYRSWCLQRGLVSTDSSCPCHSPSACCAHPFFLSALEHGPHWMPLHVNSSAP